jgi:hypothetical protein
VIYTDSRNTIRDSNDGTEYVVVGMVDSGGYEWYAEAILARQADGALFYVSDSGCSCNTFGDYGLDLTPLKDMAHGLRESTNREAMQRSIDARGETEWTDY